MRCRFSIIFFTILLYINFSSDSKILCESKADSGNNHFVNIEIDADKTVSSLPHIWNGVMGDMGLVLNPRGKRLLDVIAETSPFPYYRRTMGTLNAGIGFPASSNIYQIDNDGRSYYDFTLFDQIFDIIINSGMVPFVCISFMPDSLSSAPAEGRQPWESVDRYPPKNYDEWYNLIYALVNHVVERYGKKSAVKWKWEVWNEPDLGFFWHGTQEEFLKLYDYTAAAVKAALPEAQVGGIAEAGAESKGGLEFLKKFIEHCLHGTNYRDGSKGAPLDFITFHTKGGGRGNRGNFTSDKMFSGFQKKSPNFKAMIKKTKFLLKNISLIKDTGGIPVYITECDVDFGVGTSMYNDPSAEYRNSEYFSAFQCAIVREMLDISLEFPSNPIDGLIMDTFFFPGKRVFEGQRTLITAGDIEKPILNSLRLLGKLGTERLQFECTENPAIGGLAARSKDNSIQVMVYNYDQDIHNRKSQEVKVTIKTENDKSFNFTHYRIDHEHSNAYNIWKTLGKPVVPDKKQMSIIKKRQKLETYELGRIIEAKNEQVTISFALPHHAVSLLVLKPVD